MDPELERLRAELAATKSELEAQRTEARAASAALQSALKKSEDAVSELEQFAYITSHDLQAPLRNVTGFSQLLVKRYKSALPPEAQDFVSYIQSSVRHMQELIDDLLTYSRVGRAPERQTAKQSLLGTLRMAEVTVSGRLLACSGSILWADMPEVVGDHRMLAQLFSNLFDNALKFQPAGQVPVVQLSCEDRGEEWLFRVVDNGIGIPAEHLETIFAVFRRLHTLEEYEGTGIGLAICRKVADQHGGRIWAESAGLGQGACFCLLLPKKPPTQ